MRIGRILTILLFLSAAACGTEEDLGRETNADGSVRAGTTPVSDPAPISSKTGVTSYRRGQSTAERRRQPAVSAEHIMVFHADRHPRENNYLLSAGSVPK